MTSTAVRFTSADLDTFPDHGKRREIIECCPTLFRTHNSLFYPGRRY
jgi:hypothetical protein